jgi:hypothetical protein
MHGSLKGKTIPMNHPCPSIAILDLHRLWFKGQEEICRGNGKNFPGSEAYLKESGLFQLCEAFDASAIFFIRIDKGLFFALRKSPTMISGSVLFTVKEKRYRRFCGSRDPGNKWDGFSPWSGR